jgi:hypothetical protein
MRLENIIFRNFANKTKTSRTNDQIIKDMADSFAHPTDGDGDGIVQEI